MLRYSRAHLHQSGTREQVSLRRDRLDITCSRCELLEREVRELRRKSNQISYIVASPQAKDKPGRDETPYLQGNRADILRRKDIRCSLVAHETNPRLDLLAKGLAHVLMSLVEHDELVEPALYSADVVRAHQEEAKCIILVK